MRKPTILIVEGDLILGGGIKKQLIKNGLEVIEVSNTIDALCSFQKGHIDLAVIGTSLPDDGNGLNLVKQIRSLDRKVPIIMITDQSSESLAISALKAGVNDYFKQPFLCKELIAGIRRILSEFFHQPSPLNSMNIPDSRNTQAMVGSSRLMREIKKYFMRIAVTDSTVFITGETGTGKDLVAELIHKNSPRHNMPFICINSAALPESLLESELFGYERGAFTGAVAPKHGKFELANGGTIFLDEIGDMKPQAQAKILRAIERKEIYRLGGKRAVPLDIRIIAATNQDPEQMVFNGNFRKDLYYRLNITRVHLPPLRDRKEDIPPLIDHYINELNCRFNREVKSFTKESLSFLLYYDWPGNIRELKNVLECSYINLPPQNIFYIDLPESFRKRLKKIERSPQNEKNLLLSTLFTTNWNKSKTAQRLHWSRMTLYRKMEKYQILTPQHKK